MLDPLPGFLQRSAGQLHHMERIHHLHRMRQLLHRRGLEPGEPVHRNDLHPGPPGRVPLLQPGFDVRMKAHETPGLLPLLHLELVPFKPYGQKVRGEIFALYVVGDITSEQRLQFAELIPGVEAKDFAYTARNAEELLERSEPMGRPGPGQLELVAWEWF